MNKEYRLVDDQQEGDIETKQIEVIETIEVKRVINIAQLRMENENLDTQIAHLQELKDKNEVEINDAKKSLNIK